MPPFFYSFTILSVDNLVPGPGSNGIDSTQTGGIPQVGGSFTVGPETPQTITIRDETNEIFEDGTARLQFLVDPITVGGVTIPAGTQVQNEFVLTTDFNGVEIIALRFDIGDSRSTLAYATTGPLPPGTVFEVNDTRDGDEGAINAPDIICFASGTRIATPDGERPVDELARGDLVLTRDHGPQPVQWIGRRSAVGQGRFAPVCNAAGALGNARALILSQQHCVAISDWRAEMFLAQDTVLTPIRHLVDGRDIAIRPRPIVTYFHIMCDRHEIVFAEGLPVETLNPDLEAARVLTPDQVAEVLALFPELGTTGAAFPVAREFEGRVIAAAAASL